MRFNKFAKSPIRPFLGGLVKSLAGPLLGGLFSSKGASDANQANSAMAANQMEFQERMSNTQYQRGVADMKAAGLSPMLAYSQGGASSPSGASAQMQDTITPGISTAMQYKRNQAEVENLELTGDLIKAQRDKTAQETINLGTQSGQIVADTEKSKATTRNLDSSTNVNIQNVEKIMQDVKESYSREDLNRATEKLKNLSMAEAKAAEAFFKSGIGSDSPFIKFVMGVLSTMRGVGR